MSTHTQMRLQGNGQWVSAAGLLCLFPAHYGDHNAEDKRLYINTGWMGAVVCCEASVLGGAAEPSSTFKCDQQNFAKWETMLTGPRIQLMKPVWVLIDLKLRLLFMLATFVIYCDNDTNSRAQSGCALRIPACAYDRALLCETENVEIVTPITVRHHEVQSHLDCQLQSKDAKKNGWI